VKLLGSEVSLFLDNLILILTSGFTAAFLLFLYLLKNPEKVEKWGSILYKIGAYVSEKSEKRYMATNIQYTINEARKELGLGGDVISYGLNVKWTEENSVEIDLKENNVIVMLKPFGSQSKNLANVISLYIPNTLLPKARKYVDDYLMKGIDYIFGKNFLIKNPTALDYYVDNESKNHTAKIKEYINKIDKLNESGKLSRILVQEFKNFNTLYPQDPSEFQKEDSINLFNTIYQFEILDPGESIDGAGIHISENFKMAVVPVGRSQTLIDSGIEKHLIFILEHIPKGIKNFYIVGAGVNIRYAKSLTERVCKIGNVNIVYQEEFNGTFRGIKQKLYCSLCSVP
jgi:hypothetical protein